MEFILNATNLLGDSLYFLKPLHVWLARPDNKCKAIVCAGGLVYDMFVAEFSERIELFSNLEVAQAKYPDVEVLTIAAGDSGHYCFTQSQAAGRQLHISEGYAHILGVDLKGDVKPPMAWAHYKERERNIIAISPFSKSCSRHSGMEPNKTLDDWKWEGILRYLRRQGMPVKVIAGPNDRMSLSVPEEDYFTANTLEELKDFLAQCALVVTLDNGLGHVASILNTPTISLWPKVSNTGFIAPRFGEKTVFVMMQPSEKPAELLHGIRLFTKVLLDERHAKVFLEAKQKASAQSAQNSQSPAQAGS